jgi:hypothetical protein
MSGASPARRRPWTASHCRTSSVLIQSANSLRFCRLRQAARRSRGGRAASKRSMPVFPQMDTMNQTLEAAEQAVRSAKETLARWWHDDRRRAVGLGKRVHRPERRAAVDTRQEVGSGGTRQGAPKGALFASGPIRITYLQRRKIRLIKRLSAGRVPRYTSILLVVVRI